MTNPVTSARQGIENIRRSLNRAARVSSPQEAPLVPSAQLRTGPRPAIYASRQAASKEAEIDCFLEEVKKLSGVGARLEPEGISNALQALVSEQNVRKATVWDTALLEELAIKNLLNALGVDLVSPQAEKHEMALCDLGVTEADFLLPETGTVVLRSSAEKPRAVSLLPRIHLALVRPEMLRADMHQVFAEAKGSNYLVFITGPSRTADIELTTTLGVHGPRELFVWMINE